MMVGDNLEERLAALEAWADAGSPDPDLSPAETAVIRAIMDPLADLDDVDAEARAKVDRELIARVRAVRDRGGRRG